MKTKQLIEKIKFYILLFLVSVFLQTAVTYAQGIGDSVNFKRPMTLITQEQIDIVKERISQNIEPQASEFGKLIQDANDAQTFVPDVPTSVFVEDDGLPQQLNYWRVLMWNQTDPGLASALGYVYTGNTEYADKAVEILNAWASEAPTIGSTNSRHRDLIIGQGFLRLVHIADLVWNYEGWDEEDRDELVDYLKYVDSRSTGYWRIDSIGDNARLFTLALGCLIQDEQRISDVEESVQNWFTADDPTWGTTNKLAYHEEYEVEHFAQQTHRGASGFGYSFNEGAPVLMISQIFWLLGWDILDIAAATGGSVRGVTKQTAQWYLDFQNEIWDTYPFYENPEEMRHRPNSQEMLEYLNNFMNGEFTELQQWLTENRGSMRFGWYFDPYITLNRGDIYSSDIDNDLPEEPKPSETEQTIVLQEGWNIISSYIEPDDKDIVKIFSGIQGNISLISNSSGEVYWPEYNINEITTWDYNEGYQVNMITPDTLIIYGKQLIPEATPISLSRGWNIKPYIVDQPMPVETALESIASDLELVTNNSGEIYWPEYNVNDIGDMQPGEGYKLFLNNETILTYPSPSPSAMKIAGSTGLQQASTTVTGSGFYKSTHLNTGVQAILLIQSGQLEDGDEVAVWSEDNVLIGNGIVSNNQSAVTIWGRDSMDENSELGARDDELLRLTVWLQSEREERPLTIKSLSSLIDGELDNSSIRYKKNSVLVAEVFHSSETPSNYLLHQNYPNPFNPSTTIEYSIPNDEMVKLEVYNILGQKIATLIDEKQYAGRYEVVFKAEELSSGVYFYRLNAGNYTEIKRMILLR